MFYVGNILRMFFYDQWHELKQVYLCMYDKHYIYKVFILLFKGVDIDVSPIKSFGTFVVANL